MTGRKEVGDEVGLNHVDLTAPRVEVVMQLRLRLAVAAVNDLRAITKEANPNHALDQLLGIHLSLLAALVVAINLHRRKAFAMDGRTRVNVQDTKRVNVSSIIQRMRKVSQSRLEVVGVLVAILEQIDHPHQETLSQ